MTVPQPHRLKKKENQHKSPQANIPFFGIYCVSIYLCLYLHICIYIYPYLYLYRSIFQLFGVYCTLVSGLQQPRPIPPRARPGCQPLGAAGRSTRAPRPGSAPASGGCRRSPCNVGPPYRYTYTYIRIYLHICTLTQSLT